MINSNLKRLDDFEQISNVAPEIVKSVLKEMKIEDVALAYMGTSPDNRQYIEELYDDKCLGDTIRNLGAVPIVEIEKQQLYIVQKINEILQ